MVMRLEEPPQELTGGADLARWLASGGLGASTALSLLGRRLIDDDLEILLARPELQGVTTLWLSSNDIRARGVRLLADCAYLAGLSELQLGYNHRLGDDGGVLLAASPYLTHLTRLGMDETGIGDVGLAALASSPNLQHLRLLELERNFIGALGIRAVAASPYLSSLYELRLESNGRIGDDGAVALAATDLRHLTYLDLCGTGIGDAGAIALATAPALGEVRTLVLCGNRIGDMGAMAIAQSHTLRRLTVLDLTMNPIGPSGVAALRAAPHLQNLVRPPL